MEFMSCAFFALTYLREHLRDECRCSLTPSFPLIPLSLVSALSLALSSCSLSHALSRLCARSLRFRLNTLSHTHTNTHTHSLSLSLSPHGRAHARTRARTHTRICACTHIHACMQCETRLSARVPARRALRDIPCGRCRQLWVRVRPCVRAHAGAHARAYTWTLEERGASCRATRAEAMI